MILSYMRKTIEIPEGYEARIESNKIILEPKESEDERIKKELIGFLQEEIDSINRLVSGDYDDRDADDIAHQNWCKKALAWLEKQGEQNLDNPAKTCKIEQNPAWSEEDEDVINHLLAICAGAKRYRQFAGCLQEDITKYQTWLKSLKERYTWKPSDEHYELKEFAKIVRGNLTGISNDVQEKFKAKYLQLTGNKMYGGYKD